MGDALRRLFLSIGVALGLATGQSDPSLVARAYLDSGRLLVDARIDEAFAPGAIDLVESGTRVALRYSARLEAEGSGESSCAEAEETRVLRYELRSARYEVAYGGKRAALADANAARGLASELQGLALCGEAEARGAMRVIVRAQIGIIDARGAWHDAPVLWNYSSPRAVLALGQGAGRVGR